MLDGPIAGTLIDREGSSWSHELDSVSTIFGLYEASVNERIVALCQARRFSTFVHIGCSSGVLGVGLLRKGYVEHGVFIDTNPDALKIARKNSELNEVTSCSFSQSFTSDLVTGTALFLIDIEGFENEFFKQHLAALLGHTVIIEIHEKGHKQKQQATELIETLRAHFDIEFIGMSDASHRLESLFAEVAGDMTDYERFCLTSEGRSHLQRWAICTPRVG